MKSTFDKKKFELNIVLPLESISYILKKKDLVKGLYNVPGIVAGILKKKYGDYIVNIRPNIKIKKTA
jgi:hypothetical protein